MTSIRYRAPSASSLSVRERMRRIRRTATRGERVVATAFKELGFRIFVNLRPDAQLHITVDIVIPSHRLCLFVDGCFWHGCPWHFTTPRTHHVWWSEKIEDNRRRDQRQSRALRRRGWHVWRVWEHSLAASLVARTVRSLVHRLNKLPEHRTSLPNKRLKLAARAY
jgi:DNA mismatch endonuclease, patch repair protein